jgi:hypothetical protein
VGFGRVTVREESRPKPRFLWFEWKTADGRDRPLHPHAWDPETGIIIELGRVRKVHVGHFREVLVRLARKHSLKRAQVRLIAKKLEGARNIRQTFMEAVQEYTNIQKNEVLDAIATI